MGENGVDQSYTTTPRARRLSNALTSIRAINKTDAMTLSSNLGSLADIMRAPQEDLVMCPGEYERASVRADGRAYVSPSAGVAAILTAPPACVRNRSIPNTS